MNAQWTAEDIAIYKAAGFDMAAIEKSLNSKKIEWKNVSSQIKAGFDRLCDYIVAGFSRLLGYVIPGISFAGVLILFLISFLILDRVVGSLISSIGSTAALLIGFIWIFRNR
jgi:hypothetical protein